MSYICYETLLLCSICNKCGNEDEKIFMEQESIIEVLISKSLIYSNISHDELVLINNVLK